MEKFLRIVLFSLFLIPTTEAKETARVLPPNIIRFRAVGVLTSDIDRTFNDDGSVQRITESLNRSVTVKDFVASEPALQNLVDAMNLAQPGLGDELLGANLYSDFRVRAQIYIAAVEYGLSDRLTLGARAPIVNRSAKHKFSVDGVNNAIAALKDTNPAAFSEAAAAGLIKASDLTLNEQFFVQKQFTQKGYQAPGDFDKTELGDAEVGLKYQFVKQEKQAFAVTSGVRAPTGSTGEFGNAFDKGTGTGAWAFGAQADYEYFLSYFWTVGLMAKSYYSFASSRRMGVPKNAADTLPNLRDEFGQVQHVSIQRGPEYETEAAVSYEFLQQSVMLWTAYGLKGKFGDDYIGPGNFYYEGLEKGTDTFLTTANVGVGYSTIPAFRKKAFKFPMQVQTAVTFPLTGRNTTLATQVRTDLIFYF